MAQIVSIPEMYTGEMLDLGTVYEIGMHFRAVLDDETEAWFYFGTDPQTIPPPPNTTTTIIERPAVRFPSDFYNLPESSDLIRDLAFEVARNVATK